MVQPAGNGGTFVVTMPLQRHVSADKTTRARAEVTPAQS